MKEDLGKILNHLKRTSYEYEVLRLIFVFLGAAISIPLSQKFGMDVLNQIPEITIKQDHLSTIQFQMKTVTDMVQRLALEDQQYSAQQELFYSVFLVIVYVVILYFIPILLSLTFTKLSSEKQIVPPLYMQLIVFAYSIIYYSYNPDKLTDDQRINFVSLIGIYSIFAGITQNGFVIWMIGLSPTAKDIPNRFSLRVEAGLQRIENILTREPWKGNLYLKTEFEVTRRGIEFRTDSRKKFEIIIELQKITDDETIINMVAFDKGTYYFRTSPELDGFAVKNFLYLKHALANDDYSVRFEEISSNNCEHLINTLKEQSKGAYAHLEAVSKETLFRIMMFVVAIALIGALFYWSKETTNAILSVITVVLYLAFELTRLSRKKNKTTN